MSKVGTMPAVFVSADEVLRRREKRLIELGRNVIRERLRVRHEAKRKSAIVDAVNKHIHEAAIDLQDILREINGQFQETGHFEDRDIDAEVDRL